MPKKIIFPHILLMKAGPYCGYSLDEIIEIKQKEERKCGKFFWGYGGVFCRPDIINNFIAFSKSKNVKSKGFFSITNSVYQISGFGKFSEFSRDGLNWQKLPENVLLVGNIQKPHFAVIGRNLRKCDIEIDIRSVPGIFAD
jgi:hypothetical protein